MKGTIALSFLLAFSLALGKNASDNTNLRADKAQPTDSKIQSTPPAVSEFESQIKSQSGEEREKKTDAYNAETLRIQREATSAAEYQAGAGRLMVIIAGVEVLIAWLAFLYLKRTFNETQSMAKAAKDAVETADRQLELANATFTSTNRPKLIVRNFRLDRISKDKVNVHYRVSNVGGSTATIEDWSESYLFTSERTFPVVPHYCSLRPLSEVQPIECGRSLTVTFTIEVPDVGDAIFQDPHGAILFVFGFMHYRDGLKQSRELLFCRLFNPRTMRFDIGEPEHENAD